MLRLESEFDWTWRLATDGELLKLWFPHLTDEEIERVLSDPPDSVERSDGF